METLKFTFGTSGSFNLSVSAAQNNHDNLLKIVMEESGPNSYMIHLLDGHHLDSAFPVFKAGDQTCFFKFKHGTKRSNLIKMFKGAAISSFPINREVYGLEVLNQSKQKMFESKGGHSLKDLTVCFGVLPEYGDETGIYRRRRNYALEKDRLESFSAGWLGPVSVRDLAKGGFYRISSDKARCYFCNLEVVDWESTDTARGEHFRWNPNCPFMVQKHLTRNVALEDDFNQEFAMGPSRYDGGVQTDGCGPKPSASSTVALNTGSNDSYQLTCFDKPRVMMEKTFTFSFGQPPPKTVDGLYVDE